MKLFSLEGRIGRGEYMLSLIAFLIVENIISYLISYPNLIFLELFYVPIFWMLIAQGTKRCHDLGKNGWLQIIPLFVFLLVFKQGQPGVNEFDASANHLENLTTLDQS